MKRNPYSYDSLRLPPHELCEKLQKLSELQLNRLLLKKSLYIWQQEAYDELIKDQFNRARFWGLATTATSKRDWVINRRYALGNMRDLVGYRTYYMGDWPEPMKWESFDSFR